MSLVHWTCIIWVIIHVVVSAIDIKASWSLNLKFHERLGIHVLLFKLCASDTYTELYALESTPGGMHWYRMDEASHHLDLGTWFYNYQWAQMCYICCKKSMMLQWQRMATPSTLQSKKQKHIAHYDVSYPRTTHVPLPKIALQHLNPKPPVTMCFLTGHALTWTGWPEWY